MTSLRSWVVATYDGRVKCVRRTIAAGYLSARLQGLRYRSVSHVRLHSPRVDPDSSRLTVLIVDHDRATRDTFDQVLRSLGFDVDVTSSGAEAMTIARRRALDLLIVGQHLPDMLGTDFVRALQETVKVPWILFSGALTVADTVEAMRLGAANVIETPTDAEALVAVVRSTMRQRPPASAAVSPADALIRSRPRSAAARRGKPPAHA